MSKEHAYAYKAGYIDGSTHYELEHCPACKNVADLQEALAENDKLRKLVLDLYRLSDTYFEDRELYWWKPYEQRMRELGIEVDE